MRLSINNRRLKSSNIFGFSIFSTSLLVLGKNFPRSSKEILELLKDVESTIDYKLVYSSSNTFGRDILTYTYTGRGNRDIDRSIHRLFSREGSLYGHLTFGGQRLFIRTEHGITYFTFH